jgi:SNF2 family DNA or RNA helicase
MIEFELYKHQFDALNLVKNHERVGFYLEMGLGKSILGILQSYIFDNPQTLLVCPKSLIPMWINTFDTFFPNLKYINLTKTLNDDICNFSGFGIINYDILFRRQNLLKLTNFTLLLDESSRVRHDTSKRTKFILKLKPKNVVLLSGSPCAGKYENLYTNAKLLGVKYTKGEWWDDFIKWSTGMTFGGNRFKQIYGYKNIDSMMNLMTEHGAVWMASEDVLTMPERVEQTVLIQQHDNYKTFIKNRIVKIDDVDWVGDNTLTLRLRARMLCASWNKNKINRIEEILEETNERVIIFYSFKQDYEILTTLCIRLNKPLSVVNGDKHDLYAYNHDNNSVTLIQYQSGAYGLNLQKCNKIIHFSLPESCDLFMQSEARIRRIGQKNTCWYYYLICEKTVENDILSALKRGEDYNDALFDKYLENLKK